MPRCPFSERFLVGGIDNNRWVGWLLKLEGEVRRYGGADHGNPENQKSVKRIEGFQIKGLDGIPNVARTGRDGLAR